MPDKILKVNIPLPPDRLQALVDFSLDYNITAEQMASQIVQQWVNSLLPSNKYVSRKTD